MTIDKQIHDCIMDLRHMAIEHPQTLEVSQRCIDKLYAIKRATDHATPPEDQKKPTHYRPVRICNGPG